jgi:diaminopimelate epimerase
MRFAKGHGTGNDFLIVPDPDGGLALSPLLVSRLCDRRTGLGADGILRAVRVGAAGLDPGPATPAEWFMDYRNADGSVAEMCGNGIRVFARYLLDHGLADGPELAVATRAGLRHVTEEPSGELTVDMGTPELLGHSAAVIGGSRYEGMEVSLGNPHLACLVDVPVAGIDLTQPPLVDHARFPDGANVEVLRILGPGCVEMRVHERGSGMTLSCGTGAVAAAVAARVATGASAGKPSGNWTVLVPGGELTVRLSEGTSLLTGPAEIVAEGEVARAWLSGLAGGRVPAGAGGSSRAGLSSSANMHG